MRGEAFEREVFERLCRLHGSGQLGLAPGNCRIYRQHDYYSSPRKSPIRADVSVELFRPSATEPYLVWIWECKDYGSRGVPVKDVEVLHSKVLQLGASRTKGTLATRSYVQKGGYNLAREYGIGIVRVLSGDESSWILESNAAGSACEASQWFEATTLPEASSADAVCVSVHGVLVHGIGPFLRHEMIS